MTPPPSLLVIGASARAAVWSSRGIGPIAAIDQFGDADTREMADVLVSTDYPRDLPALAGRVPDCPWIYTGALENHPRIVRDIAAERPLLGNDADVLRLARDPSYVADVLAAAGLPFLPVRRASDGLPDRGDWMLKPLRSAAGRGVAPWHGESLPKGTFLQRRAQGESFSSVHLATPPHVELVGVSRQLFRPGSFEWTGNVGPVELPDTIRETVASCGERLAHDLGLRGLFGLDFVVEDGVPFVVEINPRYTASVEVHERATGRRLLLEHIVTFGGHAGIETVPEPQSSEQIVLKRILFADRAITATRELEERRIAEDAEIADVPVAGSEIPVGAPSCTLIVTAADETMAIDRADGLVADVAARLSR